MIQKKFWGSLESFLHKKVKLTPGQDYATVGMDDLIELKRLFNSIVEIKWETGAKGSPVDFRILSSENQFFEEGCICVRESGIACISDSELLDLIVEELRAVLKRVAKSKKNNSEIRQQVEDRVNSRMYIFFKQKALGTLATWEVFCDETNNTKKYIKETLVVTFYYGMVDGKMFQIRAWIDFKTMSFHWFRS